MNLLPARGSRNTLLSLVFVLVFAAVALAFAACDLEGLEWVVAGFVGLSLSSSLRAWGEYRHVVTEDDLELMQTKTDQS